MLIQIMRCSAYSSATNRPLYVPANDAGSTEDGDGQEAHKALVDSSAIQHFHDKLLHIKDRMKVRTLLCAYRLIMLNARSPALHHDRRPLAGKKLQDGMNSCFSSSIKSRERLLHDFVAVQRRYNHKFVYVILLVISYLCS
jgi:hypothetical protein